MVTTGGARDKELQPNRRQELFLVGWVVMFFKWAMSCRNIMMTSMRCVIRHWSRSHEREACHQYFPTVSAKSWHSCPLRQPLQRILQVDEPDVVPVLAPNLDREPDTRHIYADGSGGQDGRAGWAAVVFDCCPTRPTAPEFTLNGRWSRTAGMRFS